MNADVHGALEQIDRSWKAFVHNGKTMTKEQVKAVLEYADKKGYKHTGQITDEEVNNILSPLKKGVPMEPKDKDKKEPEQQPENDEQTPDLNAPENDKEEEQVLTEEEANAPPKPEE